MKSRAWWIVSALALAAVSLGSQRAMAHCDTMDGPVVTAAQMALEKREPGGVLIWVHKKDEAEVLEAFQLALAVRNLSPQARELADTYFFETLVRVHRAGEGAPYTGLKPASGGPGRAIAATDEALKGQDVSSLEKLLEEAVAHGVHDRFREATAARKRAATGDVEAGRAYVARYVELIHWVERLYESATTSPAHHETESAPPHAH